MDSFEDLGLRPELVEALAAEGIERPTPLQELAMPVVRRGHNLVLAAGPGSGVLVAWGAALLDRLDPEGGGPAALALTPTAETASRLAESLARIAQATGHRVAALGTPWARPEAARVVFGTPGHVLDAVAAGALSLASVEALVVDQAGTLAGLDELVSVEGVVDFIPGEAQRVVVALPVTPPVSSFVERHVRRAATVPPASGEEARRRGVVRLRVVPEPREDGVLASVAELFAAGDARHVLVFCRSEDRAADVGDYLSLHGFAAGAPGDADAPVWLGVDALEARATAAGLEGVVVVSCDVPAGPDELDRRHGIGAAGIVVALPREVAHIRDVARRTGYELGHHPLPRRADTASVEATRDALERALEDEDVDAYLPLLDPLFERHDPARVAAAATALLRAKLPPPARRTPPAPEEEAVRRAPAWVKVFVSVGERDGLKPSDLVGAVTGEAGVPGSAVGKIEIHHSHTVVEIQESVARQVIRALNGTTIRGRSVRADVDRPRRGSGRPAGRDRPPRRS